MTMLEKFFEMHPNAQIDTDGFPRVCPDAFGWPIIDCDGVWNCDACWNREYKEEYDKKN